jgi:hypothetical protein
METMPDEKPTIEAKRRRPGGTAATAGRAETPGRRRAGGSGDLPPPSIDSGLPKSSLPGGPPRKLSLGCILVLIVLFFILRQFMGGTDSDTNIPETNLYPTEEFTQAISLPVELPTSRPTQPRPTRTSSSTNTGNTWLIMLYQDADDKILEKDIYVDLNEAERVGSSANVQIVAQIDRYRGGYQGDGDWVSARRYYVTQNDDLQRIGSEELADLGEVNMSDGQTLVDFVTWAMQNYPADKYAMILSDHGMGWPGGWSDPTARGGASDMPLARSLGDQLYLNELDQALEQVRSQSGLDKFELIGMDACLMGHLEVFSALAPHARYAVTSQETEPALGWAYAAFLDRLTANPGMSGAELGQAIVDSYIQDDQRIVDDQARADLVGPGLLMNSLFGGAAIPSASQVTSEIIQNATLAAVDLNLIPEVLERFNDLAYYLQEAEQRDVAQARSYAQSFTSIFGEKVPPSYIDLSHFAQLVGRTSNKRSIGEASNQLVEVLGRAVIAERHGQKRPGATGVSIYFPNSALYRSPEAGPDSYTVAARRFASESLWDEFLAYHYTGRAFERGDRLVTLPERGATIEAPAAGGIQISSLQASAGTVEPGQSIRLTSDISGVNIGYVRLLVGFLDKTNNSIYVADSDFLESPQTRQLNGVYYPDWGTDPFTLAFSWEPIVFAIDDGATSVVALLNPENYGASPEEAIYSAEGIYTFADGGERRYARLYFSNGQLRQVFGFTGEDGSGAPREITPQQGDTFTILEKWMDLDAQGKVTQVIQQEGEMLTFGEKMFTWKQLYAAAGDYIVGFVVEDLDGNSQTSFVQVVVR